MSASWVLQAISLTLNHYYLFYLEKKKKKGGDTETLDLLLRGCYAA